MNDTTNNGGPAFPVSSDNYANPYSSGMNMRDYFAAKAMQAHITASFQALAAQYANYPDVITRTIAKAAYKTADAMLKARGQA